MTDQYEHGERGPEPARVRYNDWRQVEVPARERFTPTLPVSVVISSFQTPPETLSRTLAALEGQTYPRDLFEVVIVDDGSEPPLERPGATPMAVRVVRQERCGFGLTRARNTGARAAAGDVLLFLDSDTLAEADWVEMHARWHHAVSDALTVGLRHYVAMDGVDAEMIGSRTGTLKELFSGRQADPPWIESHLARTRDLTSKADDIFRVVVGGNFGIGKHLYWEVGGSDESFTRWGQMDDTELGYRVYTRGGLLVPVRESVTWHQGRWAEDRDAKNRLLHIQRQKAAHLIAHRQFRSGRPGRLFTVPQHVVTVVDAGHLPVHQVIRTVTNILDDRVHDLVVRIETQPGDDDERLTRLQEEFGPDQRVRVGTTAPALDEFPAASFHLSLPAGVSTANLIHRLRTRLGNAVAAVSVLTDGSAVSITRTWALHRVQRAGGCVADFGEVRTFSIRTLRLKVAEPRWIMNRPASTWGVDYPTKWDRLRDWARGIRSVEDALLLLKGVAIAVRRWRATRRCADGRHFERARK